MLAVLCVSGLAVAVWFTTMVCDITGGKTWSLIAVMAVLGLLANFSTKSWRYPEPATLAPKAGSVASID
jgi:hypothetical protein